MNIGNLYMTRVPKSYSTNKKIDVVTTKLHLSKHKNGNDYANNNKSEHVNIKKNKTPRLTDRGKGVPSFDEIVAIVWMKSTLTIRLQTCVDVAP